MTITRIICIVGIAAFSLLAAEAPAYADNFGSDPNGNYYLWGPLWADQLPQANPPTPPQNEIIGAWLSEEWYFTGFENTLNDDSPSLDPPPANDPGGTESGNIVDPVFIDPGATDPPVDPPSTLTETYENTPTGNPGTNYLPQGETTPPVVTPEPGSLLLLGTGLAGLGLFRRRQLQRQRAGGSQR